jgi:type IV secretory pathway VirB10-like protein
MRMKFRHRSSILSRRWALSIVQCALTAALAAGCAKARAQTVPDGPPLATPPPPSRVFAPLEEEPLVSSPVAEAPAAPAPRVPTTRPPAPRPTPAESERPAAPPTPAPAVEAPRELRAASLPGDPESERRITELVRNANRDLRGVDYGRLTRGGKESYDQAKGFVEEAEKALKERNFVYAQTAADKAAKLASELLGR